MKRITLRVYVDGDLVDELKIENLGKSPFKTLPKDDVYKLDDNHLKRYTRIHLMNRDLPWYMIAKQFIDLMCHEWVEDTTEGV